MKLNTTIKDLNYRPCDICNEKESCKSECLNFKKYYNSATEQRRKKNYDEFLKMQEFTSKILDRLNA